MAEFFKKPHGESIGVKDDNGVFIKVGDYMRVEHDCNCVLCKHHNIAQITWNDKWGMYGMKTEDGYWIGRPTTGSFLIHKPQKSINTGG